MAGAAIVFGGGDAEHAEGAHFRPEIHGKGVVPVDCRGPGAISAAAKVSTWDRSMSADFAQVEIQSRHAVQQRRHSGLSLLFRTKSNRMRRLNATLSTSRQATAWIAFTQGWPAFALAQQT